MRALGIDFGEKRIGLAISDPAGRWALPLTTLERGTDRRAAYAIAEIARREGVSVLVLGEPLGGDGVAGEATERVRRFGQRLRRAARLPVVRVNEALTPPHAAARCAARRGRGPDPAAGGSRPGLCGERRRDRCGRRPLKRRLWRFFFAGLLLVLATGGTAAGWAWRRLHQPYQGYEDAEKVVAVRSGQGASTILHQLEDAGVLADARLARLYLVHVAGDPPLIAGEYRFDQPLSTPEVLAKLIRGEIVTYPATLIEGLTLEESADALARQGFGSRDRLLREMQRPELVADLDTEASDLEGYLYPDTYRFARGTPEAEIVTALLRTFRQRYREEVEPLLAESRGDGPQRTVREIVTLASIVEKEARLDEERALIAGVYAHRLRRGIALYADPTVIYALKRLGTWDGNLRRVDLRLDSPYNTYVYPGLPPGPICSPSVASLVAAAVPADTPYLYFVSRNDGSHAFAESLAEHHRNVEVWQRQYWRRRWAEERAR